MPLTEEVMRTELYDKVDEYETLEYTNNSYRLEEHKEKDKEHYKIFFDFETITSEENICLTYAGFTMVIYKKNLLVLIIVQLIC
jgi:tRNA1(Val) A37 N6-methylase TrmN6